MTQAELGYLKGFEEIRELALGSVLSGGASDPEDGNGVSHWTDVYDECQKNALATRLGIPILYGTDAGVLPHDMGGWQFGIMVERGMTPTCSMDCISRLYGSEGRQVQGPWPVARNP